MLRPSLILLCAVALASCGNGEGTGSVGAGESEAAPGRSILLDCADAVLGVAAPVPRARATVSGTFALLGPGRNFEMAQRRRGGDLFTKIPAIVSGDAAVTLSVPLGEQGAVGLYPPNAATKVEQAYTEVTFEPCPERRATGWPFGLILSERDPVELLVREAGAEGGTTISVGRT
jgi:hypothetical protein